MKTMMVTIVEVFLVWDRSGIWDGNVDKVEEEKESMATMKMGYWKGVFIKAAKRTTQIMKLKQYMYIVEKSYEYFLFITTTIN